MMHSVRFAAEIKRSQKYYLKWRKNKSMNTLSWFFDFPVSIGVLIIGTVVVAVIATVTFAKGLWKL